MIPDRFKNALAFLQSYVPSMDRSEPGSTRSIGHRALALLQSYTPRMDPPEPGSAQESIRRYTIAGVAVVVFLTFGVGVWATTVEIAGALIAPGTVVVESNIKKVQHPTGGVVGELRVKDGDRVKAADLLVRLDDTVTRANLAIVTKTLTELTARKARLSAERDGSESITFPKELLREVDVPDVAQVTTIRACFL